MGNMWGRPEEDFDSMTDEEWRNARLAVTEPWTLEGITAASWIAQRRDTLCGLDIPKPTERFARFGGMSKPLPLESGVYFLFDADGVLLYIGKATNLEARIHGHWAKRAIPFRGVTWRELPVIAAEILEAYLIAELDPPYNVKFCSNMRHWSNELAKALANPVLARACGEFV